MSKMPAFQFYPGDWLKDPALRAVSSGARGLWIDMLCLMHESVHRGYLQHSNGQPVTHEQIARMTGNLSLVEVEGWIAELENCGVFSRSTSGVIYNRRMVRDEHKRRLCQEAGKRGGNPTLNRQSKGESKGGAKGESKGESNPNPTPSSSSSLSPSGHTHTHARAQEEPGGWHSQEFAALFGKPLALYQLEQVQAVVTERVIWAEVLSRWKINGYSERNLSGILDAYRRALTPPATQRNTNGTSQSNSSQPSAAQRKQAEYAAYFTSDDEPAVDQSP